MKEDCGHQLERFLTLVMVGMLCSCQNVASEPRDPGIEERGTVPVLEDTYVDINERMKARPLEVRDSLVIGGGEDDSSRFVGPPNIAVSTDGKIYVLDRAPRLFESTHGRGNI